MSHYVPQCLPIYPAIPSKSQYGPGMSHYITVSSTISRYVPLCDAVPIKSWYVPVCPVILSVSQYVLQSPASPVMVRHNPTCRYVLICPSISWNNPQFLVGQNMSCKSLASPSMSCNPRISQMENSLGSIIWYPSEWLPDIIKRMHC